MKSVLIRILMIVVIVEGAYTFIGRLVPQFTGGYPPKATELKPGVSQEDLVKAGQDIVSNRGCLTCHTIGGKEAGRCPNLQGVGATAARRIAGHSAEQYLLHRLTDPDSAGEVPGFPKIMPPVWKPPIALTWPEVKAVAAYLESLGGKVTINITADDVADKPHSLSFPGGTTVTVKKMEAQKEIPPEKIAEGHDVMMGLAPKEQCIACHKLGTEQPQGWAPIPGQFCPDLSNIGQMHDADYVKQKIENPQSLPTVTGYPKTMMPMDFQKNLQAKYGAQYAEKLDALVQYVISHRGGGKKIPELSPYIIGGMLVLSLVLGFLFTRGG